VGRPQADRVGLLTRAAASPLLTKSLEERLQVLDVVEILVPPSGALVPHEVRQTDHGQRDLHLAAPEVAQCIEETGDVRFRLLVPEVDIARQARIPVIDDRLAAHEKEPHASVHQRGDELLDVGREVVASHGRRCDSRTSGACSP
jgi:hypothetical protein